MSFSSLRSSKVVSPNLTGRALIPTSGATFASANTELRLFSYIIRPPVGEEQGQAAARARRHPAHPRGFRLLRVTSLRSHPRLALARETHFLPDPVAAVSGTPSFSAFYTRSPFLLRYTQRLLGRLWY
eukprot:6202422-Pleurochrysis_carterae.AAC.5